MIRLVVVVEDTLIKVEYRDDRGRKMNEATVPVAQARDLADKLLRAADRYDERQRELGKAGG